MYLDWVYIIFGGVGALLLLVVLPLLNTVSRWRESVSLRWCCVAIVLLLLAVVTVDAVHLQDTTRNIIYGGGLSIIGLYILIRTIEKILYSGWLRGMNLKTTVSKGDATVTVDMEAAPSSTQES